MTQDPLGDDSESFWREQDPPFIDDTGIFEDYTEIFFGDDTRSSLSILSERED